MLQSAIRKVVGASLDVVRFTKRELEKEVKRLVSKKMIKPESAKQLLKELYGEFRTEQSRIKSFALQELQREFKRTKSILGSIKSPAKKGKRKKRRR